jgi:thiamine-monophosphate kinase
VREDELIAQLARMAPAPAQRGAVIGIGDDCAAIACPPGEELLLTTDMSIENVHFLPEVHPAAAVGHKALARGLSDIAAMGGTPRYFLVSLALAPWTRTVWVRRFYRGMLELAGRYDTQLIGGDLGHAAVLACDVTVVGTAPTGKALRRSGSRPGDLLYVSGRLGGAALGLSSRRGRAWQAHLKPSPRVELGQFLRELGATAAMDVSDGFALDLSRLLAASSAAATIDVPVPRFAGATEGEALSGGDDYELLFTLPPEIEPPARFGGVALTRLGHIRKGRAGSIRYLGRALAPRGYDHLRDREPAGRPSGEQDAGNADLAQG